MRLIDADKYCDFLNTYPLEKAQNNFMSFYRKALQNTFEFEVKAIPVEWIKRYARKICEDDGERYNSKAYGIDRMIYDWESENEH